MGLSAISLAGGGGKGSISFVVDGQGSVISLGKYGSVTIPYNGTITGWEVVECSSTPVSGSIVIDVWKDTYANYPPTVADTITGTEKPTLSAAIKNQDLTLSTWTTSVSAGDILWINIDSVTSCKKIKLNIFVNKTT